MTRRPIGDLQPPADEKCVLADEHGIGPLASKRREGGVNLATRAGVEDLKLQSHGAARRFHLAQGDLRVGSIGGIDEYGDTRGRGQHFAQQLEPLCRQFESHQIDAGQISPGRARLATLVREENPPQKRGVKFIRFGDFILTAGDRGDRGGRPARLAH